MFKYIIIPLYLFFLTVLPIVTSYYSFIVISKYTSNLIAILVTPVLFLLVFSVLCGLLSIPGRKYIRKGKVNRDLNNKEYAMRRLHAVPWTLMYYCSPIYFVILSVPLLKRVVFRLFGYKDSLDFNLHPDTWIRDLPVLHVGKGSYLANKSSVATNMVLMHGMLLVDDVTIGENSCVGMSAMVGPGTRMGNSTFVDTAAMTGLRCWFKDNVKVGEAAGVQHGVVVEENSKIGPGSIIGLRCKIGPNIKIPEGSHIHAGVRIRTQQEAESYFSEETGSLTRLRSKLIGKARDLMADKFVNDGDQVDVSTGEG